MGTVVHTLFFGALKASAELRHHVGERRNNEVSSKDSASEAGFCKNSQEG